AVGSVAAWTRLLTFSPCFQVTFTKRKFGLMKKAYELSVLCDCEIALIIFNHSNKLFQYASTDMDKVLLKYTEYNEPHESRTNADIIEALNKKHRECESPEGDEVFALTPQTEEKYKKIDEEFDKMMQSYRLAVMPAPNFAMPVTVPVTNQNTLQFSNPGSSLVTQSLVTSSLTDPRLLSPQQPALQRNTVSPGLPQRPASAGERCRAMLGGDLNNTNGACPSPVGNGYVSARASPGLLPVSNGSSLGKIIPAKSPPPPSHSTQLATNSRKPDLRVITSQSGKGLMHHLQNTQRLGVSQATHSLTTPVVSVATPSLLTQGLPFSAMPTAYNTGKSAQPGDQLILRRRLPLISPSICFSTFLPSCSPPPLPLPTSHPRQGSHLSHTTTLTVNTNPNISIKSEPVSPNRERNTATPLSTFPHQPRHEPTGRSPVDSLSSNTSSYEGSSERDDPARPDFSSSLGLLRPTSEPEGESPSVKRMRLDTWVT
ncbi:MEF2D factor, partial [Glaucidium brasilianum]|nr:MEF2D factor [Glaucidium brasilianum]